MQIDRFATARRRRRRRTRIPRARARQGTELFASENLIVDRLSDWLSAPDGPALHWHARCSCARRARAANS